MQCALPPATIGVQSIVGAQTCGTRPSVTQALLACHPALPSAAAARYICCCRLLYENQARGCSGLEAILERDPEQSVSGRFGRSLEHEATKFHTWHKPLGVAPKGATWGGAHQLLLLNSPELSLPSGLTLQPSGARQTLTPDSGACKDNAGHQRHA